MYQGAIEKVRQFTRPLHSILHRYGESEVQPVAATLFFVNDDGVAITCKHVASLLPEAEALNKRFAEFLERKAQLNENKKYSRRLRDLEKEFGYSPGKVVQVKNRFMSCVDGWDSIAWEMHSSEDLAIVKFVGFKKKYYSDHAVFVRDGSRINQGMSLCRFGFPFVEFTNFKLDEDSGSLEWTEEGRQDSPSFPLDGIVTRLVGVPTTTGIEMSTPGLKGQSGGPLFDSSGLIYGVQFQTWSAHLGFDAREKEVRLDSGERKKVANYPFLHLGRCVHVDVVKEFLREKKIEFFEEDPT